MLIEKKTEDKIYFFRISFFFILNLGFLETTKNPECPAVKFMVYFFNDRSFTIVIPGIYFNVQFKPSDPEDISVNQIARTANACN